MSASSNQQPIQRTIGRRKKRDEATSSARYVAQTQDGIFSYDCDVEISPDGVRRIVDAMIDKVRARQGD